MGSKPYSAVGMLARRFLLSKTSDGFLSFIAWVSVIGVALGVMSLTVVTSVVNGFENELTRVITGMNGDVVLYSGAEAIRDPVSVEKKIRKILPDAQAITGSFVTTLMASGPAGVAGAILEGIDSHTVGTVTAVPDRLVSGRLPQAEGEITLGASLAERIGAVEGSEVRLVIPYFTESKDKSGAKPEEPDSPRILKAHVVGIIRMGLFEYDSKFVFATLESVQQFLDQPRRVTTLKIKLPPGLNTRQAADRLTENFGYPFRSKDWSMMNKNLFQAIALEKAVIAIILTVIVIVAAFNVVSTLMMMIHDKTKEISILKVMGFKPSQGFRLFCLIGVGMGLVGTTVGVGVGLLLNQVLARTRFIELPADIYFINFLPVIVRWKEIAWVAAMALLISFLATLYPGWKVARRSPLDGIRYE